MNEEVNSLQIIVADDHTIVLDGIKSMLAHEKNIVITDTANDGKEALKIIEHNPTRFQLLLTDISMPNMTGIELCKIVKEKFPHLKVLFLSMYHSPSVIREALSVEADGYILKNSGKEELLAAIHRIQDGGTYFSQDIVPILHAQSVQQNQSLKDNINLSDRELDVLKLIVKEHTSEEIANALFISKKTVDHHRAHLLDKTNSKSTVGLVKYALKYGFEV